MTYHLIVEIDAPDMAGATARAWEIFQFTLGLPFTIKAMPARQAKAEEKADRAARREAEDIADGIVPANRRYDQEYLAKVRRAAGLEV